jgi:hypothetical protein
MCSHSPLFSSLRLVQSPLLLSAHTSAAHVQVGIVSSITIFSLGKVVDNPLHEAALLTVPRGPRGAGLSPAKAGAGAAASSETPPVVASVKLAKVRHEKTRSMACSTFSLALSDAALFTLLIVVYRTDSIKVQLVLSPAALFS